MWGLQDYHCGQVDSWAGSAEGSGRMASREAEVRRLSPITLGRDKGLPAAVGGREEESTLKRYSGVKVYLTLPGTCWKWEVREKEVGMTGWTVMIMPFAETERKAGDRGERKMGENNVCMWSTGNILRTTEKCVGSNQEKQNWKRGRSCRKLSGGNHTGIRAKVQKVNRSDHLRQMTETWRTPKIKE